MDRITRFSLKNGAAIVIVALLVTFGGLWSAGQLKKESMPDVNIPVVVVVTPYPGAGPGDVYNDVTEPLEAALQGVAGVKRVSAQSGDSFSAVIAEFSFSQDMEKAEAEVNKVVSTVKLPENAMESNVSRISFGSAPILKLAVLGDTEHAEELRADVRDRIIPALSGVEGVGEAKLAADSPAAIRIELDPDALKDEGLTAESVIQQLQAANLSFPVGTVDLGETTEPIRVGGTLSSVKDIENFQVAVYPNQGELMGEAFAQIGEGMGALGQGMGALGQGMGALANGMGEGFSAVGDGMGQLGSATGQIGMQVGLVNGIQQVQGQLVETKMGLDKLKAAASQVPTDSPEYGQMQAQITAIETQAIPGMEAAIAGMQAQIAASQQSLAEQAAKQPNAAAPSRRPSGSGGLSLTMGGGRASAGGSAKQLEPEIGTVRLGEVAKVTYASPDGAVGSRANGQPAALIDIVKTQDGNTVEVAENVAAEMETLKKGLPEGAEVITAYDASVGINASIEGMMREGLLGALFAIVVILLFLRNWRATIIAAISIPLSMLIAMVLLKQTGVTLNVMTLGGLTVAIGRVVDDSIVVIENIFSHIQAGEARTPELISTATAEVASAITSSTLTTVAVFVPLGLVTGVIGKIFQPFAITVGVSLLASLLVAVTVVPLMARWMLLKGKVPPHAKESRGQAWYRSLLSLALANRAIVVVAAIALFAGSLALLPLIGTGFVPETKEKYVNIEVSYPEGAKSTAVDATVRSIEQALETEKAVEFYQTTVGGSSDFGMNGGSGGTNKALTFVKLDSGADTEAVIESLGTKTAPLEKGDAEIVFQRVDASGTNSSLEIIVSGGDLAAIRAGSEAVEAKLAKMDGLENVSSNLGVSRPQLVVDVDQRKASEYGLNAAMVAGSVRGYVAEQEAGSIKLAGQSTKVLYSLKLDEVDRAEEMRDLELATPLGEKITLDEIATVEETGSPVAVLTREGAQYASVSGRITERDSGSVISAVEKELESVKLPAGVTYEVSGAAEQMNESFSQLGVAMIIAVGAVFLVMVLAFGEATAPLAILFSLPLAVVGGLVGLLIAGVPLDIPAMIGALMLIGIVVTNAIVLVDRVQQRRREGESRRDALLDAGATRMRPILMTAVATIMALAPLASGFSEGALISQSLAVIVIGGLTTSTLLTLIVVPVAYDLLEGAKERLFGAGEDEDPDDGSEPHGEPTRVPPLDPAADAV